MSEDDIEAIKKKLVEEGKGFMSIDEMEEKIREHPKEFEASKFLRTHEIRAEVTAYLLSLVPAIPMKRYIGELLEVSMPDNQTLDFRIRVSLDRPVSPRAFEIGKKVAFTLNRKLIVLL